jgi:hypothetical protein
VRSEDIEERYMMACFKLKHIPTDIHKGFYLMGYELGLQVERDKVALLREALEYYIYGAYARIQISPNPNCEGAYISIEKFVGEKATEALEKLKEMEGGAR